MGGKAGDKIAMSYHIAVFVLDPGGSIQQHTFEECREITAANVSFTPEALGTFSTGNHPGHADMIPFLNSCDAGTDLLNDTSTLMTRDQG
jgi:hypothetical protein